MCKHQPSGDIFIEVCKQTMRDSVELQYVLCLEYVFISDPQQLFTSVYLTTWGKVPSKETLVYNQSQRLGSWMLGYTMWAPFSHHAIFSRHQCLPAKITWIWIVCSAVQSGLQQESDDSDRQSACIQCVCTLDHYWHIIWFSSNKIPKSCWQ